MILKVIILISICQVLLYLISDKLGLKHGRKLLLLIILIGYFFILPPFFYPEPNPNGNNCGMPTVGVTLAFWVIGGGMASVLHLVYYLIRKKMLNYK